MEKLSKNKKIAIFLAINLFFVVLPILFSNSETETVFTAFVIVVSLFATFLAIKKQSFEALLVFVFLAGMESLISNFAQNLTLQIGSGKTTFVFCLSIVLGAIIVFLNRKKIKLDKAKMLFLVLTALSTASLIYSQDFNLGIFRALILLSVTSIIFCFSTIELNEQKIKKISLAFLAGVGNLAIVTILKFFLWHWKFAAFEKTSTNEIAYFFGAALLICSIGVLLEKKILNKTILFFSSILLGFETLLSNSRAVAIAILVSVLFLPATKKRILQIFVIFAIVIVLFFIANFLAHNLLLEHINYVSITQITSARDLALLVSIKSFLASPWIGNGIGSFKTISEKLLPEINKEAYFVKYFSHAHNEFSQVLSEIGIIGFILFALFYFEVFKKAMKNNLKKIFFIFISVAFLAHGLRISFFGIVLALLLADLKKSEKNGL